MYCIVPAKHTIFVMQRITNKPTKFKNMTQTNQLLRQTIVDRSKKTALILGLLLTVGTSFSFANGTRGSNSANGSNGATSANGTISTPSANGITSTPDTRNANITNSTDGITRQVSASFKQDFKNAVLLSSEVRSKFTKLTFSLNDMILFAYYAENGKLLAVVRNILSSQLPINLMMDLKQNYSDYWITELFELNGEGQNCYYVSLENADTKLVLRSNSDNTWEVYQQTDKN
jgi:hypothetical protein